MRRIKIVAGVIVGVVFLFMGVVWLKTRSGRPDVLVAKLRHATGDEREALIMRLNLARGDVLTPMIAAFNDLRGEGEFRADMLDLLFRRNRRLPDEKIEAVLRGALADPGPAVRRAAVYGFAVYMDGEKQLAVLDSLDDSDPEVRRQAYMLLSADGSSHRQGLWGLISEDGRKETKEKVIGDMVLRAKRETDPELKFLARAVLGREIETRCNKAIVAIQTSDLARAEELLRGALLLDPSNHQAKIRLVRFYLSTGEKEKAIKLAEEYGALLRIPLLSEAPVIDGDPTDKVWGEAFASDRFYHATSRWASRRTKGRSEFRIGHRDGKVYIAVFGYEDDLGKLVIKHKARDSAVFRDDCVELFFDPTNSEKDMYQFVINAGGGYFDSYKIKTHYDIESEHAAQIFRDRGYWACEFAVAASALGDRKITRESVWGMNIMRTRIGPASEQGAWWPTFGKSLNYHLYPIAVFEGL